MTAIAGFLIVVVLFLGFTNGANDNFKGVATLVGSGTTSHRRALVWATVTTFAGSIGAVWIRAELVENFSGKGLVPDAIAADSNFLAAVGFGGAVTVALATRFGFPISTTHAMTGGLIGAGLVATRGGVVWSKLGSAFFLPLLVSPVLAFAFAAIVYLLFRTVRHVLRLNPEDGKSRRILAAAHFLSAGSVGVARGLNDAPKIVALSIAAKAFDIEIGLGLVALSMAIGGVAAARRVADTMSHRITAMNEGQGFTANLITSLLVIGASNLGVPVSTTHVSCGALFGIGAVNRKAHWNVIGQILLAWITTLPVAIASASIVFLVLRSL
jgi:PiT family inorganic phosphate transporter